MSELDLALQSATTIAFMHLAHCFRVQWSYFDFKPRGTKIDVIITACKGYKNLFIAFFIAIIIFYLLFNKHFVEKNITRLSYVQ